MRRWIAAFAVVLALAGCSSNDGLEDTNHRYKGQVAEFWRPISEPNVLLPLDKSQLKLEFDLSQCSCGIYPTNVPQPDLVAFQPDQQRYAETSVTRTLDKDEDACTQKPSLVVAECMRARGWEVTNCSGRMPSAKGGALCAAAVLD